MTKNERGRPDREIIDRMRALCRPLLPEPSGERARLVPLPGIRAVLFDVYGTLLISGSGDIGTSRHAAAPLSDYFPFSKAAAAASISRTGLVGPDWRLGMNSFKTLRLVNSQWPSIFSSSSS